MTSGKNGLVALLGFLALTVLLPASSRGSTIRDDALDSDYLALATSPDYTSVGKFVNNWGYNGSGILIAPDWVLLAAHELLVASSGTFTINGSAYTSTQLYMNPGWSNGSVFNGYDIGLMHLSSPVVGVAPATLYSGLSEVGQVGTYVGYGLTGTGLTGAKILDNQERAFQNVIDGDFGNPSLILASDFDNPHTTADSTFGDATPLPLEGCLGPGDSGGGVFATIGGQTYLVGVNDFVVATDGNANSDYGDISGFARVSTFLPWITSTMVPEPPASTLLVTGTGLILLWARRFRRG